MLLHDARSASVNELAAAHPDIAAQVIADGRGNTRPATPGSYVAAVIAGVAPDEDLVPVPGVDDVLADPAAAATIAGRVDRGEATADEIRDALAGKLPTPRPGSSA